MKKLMSLVLALAMILSLAACGGKTTGTSPDSAGDSQQETPATSDGAFPEKQITIIMPWSLGGGPDTIARQVASYARDCGKPYRWFRNYRHERCIAGGG